MNKNLILQFCYESSDFLLPAYYYDYEKRLNVIKIEDKEIPYIEATSDSIVKTNVLGEADDTETVTKAQGEGDFYNCASELHTITEVKGEAHDYRISFAELDTKTFVGREKDQVDEGKFWFESDVVN